jgi:hypothetical protein
MDDRLAGRSGAEGARSARGSAPQAHAALQQFSLLLQKFEKSSRKWRFLEESCPLPARHKPRSSRAFWLKKTSWRPKLFLATAQKHCGKPKNYQEKNIFL